MDEERMMSMNDVYEEKFRQLVEACRKSGSIDLDLYTEYDVKRGLRDSNGVGVLTGLTEIADVKGYKTEHGRKVPAEGELYYQGYNVAELLKGNADRRYAFEETIYLLLFGALPTRQQLDDFILLLSGAMDLPGHFVRDVIMKATSANLMNSLQRCILSLYSYDSNPDDISVPNVLRQSLLLISKMPAISVYSYHAYRHFRMNDHLMIRNPDPKLSFAENFLQMLRPNGEFTPLEARVLDCALVLHAEHGGGNNSTFTDHVVTSTGTDTYSAMAASLASLKGPKHGGANLKVKQMITDIKEHVNNWESEEEITSYLNKILSKEAFDHSGLIYGMGHAVYTFSDPREVILKEYAKKLSTAKGKDEEFALLDRIERISIDLLTSRHKIFKPICANVDFYSGFIYTMLGIPDELYTPLFAIARMAGWSAHRLEELVNDGKIIRPAYKFVGEHRDYVPLEKR